MHLLVQLKLFLLLFVIVLSEQSYDKSDKMNEEESILMKFNSLTGFTMETTTDLLTNQSTTYGCKKSEEPCGCSSENVVLSSMKIIGGEEAVRHSWAMSVSIRLNNSNIHSCGGSILTPTYILTSAHCIAGASLLEISIAAGMHNRIEDFFTVRYGFNIYIHPNWNGSDSTYQNDIALLYILPPLPVDGNYRFARTCIPYISSWNETINYPSNGSHLVLVSWGATQYDNNIMSDTLQQASLYTIDNNDPTCLQSIYDAKTQFCAKMQEGGNNRCSQRYF